jgi:hypothetical protein
MLNSHPQIVGLHHILMRCILKKIMNILLKIYIVHHYLLSTSYNVYILHIYLQNTKI